MKKILALAFGCALYLHAGALYVETSNPQSNLEATKLKAALVARVTACHEPSKSKLEASYLEMRNGVPERRALRVERLEGVGIFAVIGSVPPHSVIDVAVTNPEYANYRPEVLLPTDEHGPQWSNAKRFFGTPPTSGDVSALLLQNNLSAHK